MELFLNGLLRLNLREGRAALLRWVAHFARFQVALSAAMASKGSEKEIDYVSKEANLTSQIESERQAAKRWWGEYGMCYLENAKPEDFTYDNRVQALKNKLAEPNGGSRNFLTALAGYTVVLAAALSASTVVATRTGVTCDTLGNVLDMATQACICQPCHLCEFKWFQGSCAFIKRDGLDLSDGSDLDMDQPLLEPTDWFLTEKEITDARGGKTRSDLAVYSSGNAVTTYTASKDFFDAAFKDLSATKEGDRVMLAAWSTDLIPLQPDVDSGNRSQFQDVVAGLVERGTSFNALVWSNVLEGQQNVDVRDGINDLPKSTVNDASALFVFDDRLPTVLSSHHQKTLILSSASASGADDHPVAYVGGIDITSDRWDTKFHNASAVRDAADITRDYQGWIDGHLRIHGPAAKDVAANFLARWNSDFVPSTGKVDDLLDFENPDYDDLELLDHASSNTTSSLGSQNVQIVRTFSCKFEHYEEFAPKGENTLFQARIKALKNAKNYIYIEDQYFVLVPELLEAILEVMPTIQRLIVVVQPPDSTTKIGGYEKYSFDMIAP
ncbi:hypothetical protein BBJ28_00007660, partial [Nothophytophthora sp. Chile5]